MIKLKYVFVLFLMAFGGMSFAQTALEIVQKADEKLKGTSNKAEMKMTIVRPDWERSMTMKTWGKGDNLGITVITAPARDKGTAFLKKGKEIWNWQPTIERAIKLPPSMMMQSWMGSDLTNDDLVKQSSIVTDYDHKKLGEETIEGRECWKIEMRPKEDAAVVWGKIVVWISKKEYLQLKTEFYDEDDYLTNTMLGKNVKKLGGRMIPTRMEVIPEEEDGSKTILEYLSAEFDVAIKDSFFSVQNMKRVR